MFSKKKNTKMGISLHFINPTLSEIEGCLLHFRFSLYEKVLDVFYRFLRSDRFWFLGFIKHSNIVLKGIRLSNLYFWEFTPMTFTSKVTFSWNSSNFGKKKQYRSSCMWTMNMWSSVKVQMLKSESNPSEAVEIEPGPGSVVLFNACILSWTSWYIIYI